GTRDRRNTGLDDDRAAFTAATAVDVELAGEHVESLVAVVGAPLELRAGVELAPYLPERVLRRAEHRAAHTAPGCAVGSLGRSGQIFVRVDRHRRRHRHTPTARVRCDASLTGRAAPALGAEPTSLTPPFRPQYVGSVKSQSPHAPRAASSEDVL